MSETMDISVLSFSYKQGLPDDADLVFDVRFLNNPHYEPDLQPLSGRDAGVAEFISGDPEFTNFFGYLRQMLTPMLPRYADKGKTHLTVAFGCTGGRHRSVFVAEQLAGWLEQQDRSVRLLHRDLERS
ncbi:MAG: RapZ C-terminal domain-containing protein [Alphaproteobacteria bacterium]